MEALAELSGIAVDVGENKIGVLRRDTMVYRQMIKPGDKVDLEAEIISYRRDIGETSVKATKNGKVAAEGKIVFAVIDKPQVLSQ
jgi:3-hydroxyacyl-[acyl-carrier-protein] dehydratase